MDCAVSIHNLHKTYDNGFSALKGVSLDVNQGDFFALLGPLENPQLSASFAHW